MEWEVGVSRCKLLYIGRINNKVLLHSTGNYMQYPIRTIVEKIFVCDLHPIAYGILVPQPGIEPRPPALEVQGLNHWTSGEVPRKRGFFKKRMYMCV